MKQQFMLIILALFLASCRGGGDDGPNQDSVTNHIKLGVSPQTISISANTMQPAPVFYLEVDVSGATEDQAFYITYNETGDAISGVSYPPFTPNGKRYLPTLFTVTLKSPTYLGVGTYKGTVSVTACLDQNCSQPISNSPQVAKIQYTVKTPTPIISTINPSTIQAHVNTFMLTVTGTYFTSKSTVLWNGTKLPTNYISDTKLTAQIPATDIANEGSATISVNDPTYGTSNLETFTITQGLSLHSVSPPNVTAGGPSFILTVLGTAFSNSAVVQWNGAALKTTHVSSTELVAQVPSADISSIGTASVVVLDPTDIIGSTTAQSVTIASASFDAVTYQINPAHTGSVTFNSVNLPANSTWSVDVGGFPSYAIIANGLVVVTAQLVLGTKGETEALALDQRTGNTVWGPIKFQSNEALHAAYDNGKLFVIYGTDLAVLNAYDISTGSLDWSKTLKGRIDYTGPPTAMNGIVYVITEELLTALDESSGKVLWSNYVSSTDTAPAVTADGVYTAFGCVSHDFRPATGETIWQYTHMGCVGGGNGFPVVSNQLVYIEDQVYYENSDILNANSGTNVGTYTAGIFRPALTSSMRFSVEPGMKNTLNATNLSNNIVAWKFTGDGMLSSSPIVVNDYVFIGSSSGNLYALDAISGQQVWYVSLNGAIGQNITSPLAQLAAGDGLLIVPSGTTVTAFTLSKNP